MREITPEERELLHLVTDMEISAKIHHSGEINLYANIGNFECAEQAVLYLRKLQEEQASDAEEEDGEAESSTPNID